MNILVIAETYPPHSGGPSTRASNLVKGLVKFGHVIVLTASKKIGEETQKKHKAFYKFKENKVEIYRVWSPNLSYGIFRERLLKYLCFIFSSFFPLLSLGHIDVIFASNPNFFSMFTAVFYSIIYNAPIVRNVDDLWPEAVYDFGLVKSSGLQKLLDFTSKITYMVASAVVTISPSYCETIVSKYGLKHKSISTIEVGVDTNTFYPIKQESIKDNFVVMYSGKLSIVYDFDTILKASKLLSKFQDIVIVIRGNGEMATEIKTKIKSLKLKNVFLQTNKVELCELCKILNSADVFLLAHKVSSSAEKGLPTKLFEYQAIGKPIVCSSNGAPAEYISSTKSGIVVPPEDPEALYKAILELYKNKEKRCILGANGLKYASDNLTTDKIAQKLSMILLSVIKST